MVGSYESDSSGGIPIAGLPFGLTLRRSTRLRPYRTLLLAMPFLALNSRCPQRPMAQVEQWDPLFSMPSVSPLWFAWRRQNQSVSHPGTYISVGQPNIYVHTRSCTEKRGKDPQTTLAVKTSVAVRNADSTPSASTSITCNIAQPLVGLPVRINPARVISSIQSEKGPIQRMAHASQVDSPRTGQSFAYGPQRKEAPTTTGTSSPVDTHYPYDDAVIAWGRLRTKLPNAAAAALPVRYGSGFGLGGLPLSVLRLSKSSGSRNTHLDADKPSKPQPRVSKAGNAVRRYLPSLDLAANLPGFQLVNFMPGLTMKAALNVRSVASDFPSHASRILDGQSLAALAKPEESSDVTRVGRNNAQGLQATHPVKGQMVIDGRGSAPLPELKLFPSGTHSLPIVKYTRGLAPVIEAMRSVAQREIGNEIKRQVAEMRSYLEDQIKSQPAPIPQQITGDDIARTLFQKMRSLAQQERFRVGLPG